MNRDQVEARLWIWSLPVWRLVQWFALRQQRRLTDQAEQASDAAATASEMADLAQEQIDGIGLLRSATDR